QDRLLIGETLHFGEHILRTPQRPFGTVLRQNRVQCVAVSTAIITATRAHKDGWPAKQHPFALDGPKTFGDHNGVVLALITSYHLIAAHITTAFLLERIAAVTST